jgi:cytosine deaminase
MMEVALLEARRGLHEGGLPVGAALFHRDGRLLGRGRNRLVQQNDPSLHAETDAFRAAGRRNHYADTVMVTTLAPCWYCSGLIRQFGIARVLVGDCRSYVGGIDWLREHEIVLLDLACAEAEQLLAAFISRQPETWSEAACT